MLNDLSIENSGKFENFCRMSAEGFEFLLNLIGADITKETTHLRKSVSAKERLAITLRFLASGDSYKSLSYLFRISPQLILCIVYEVCQALKKKLYTEIKVICFLILYSKYLEVCRYFIAFYVIFVFNIFVLT